MKFQYFPHTADIRMKVEGSSFMEIMVAGILGMANILKEDICNSEDSFEIKSNIVLKATDQTCLLIDFLSEVLSHSYLEKSIYCKVNFIKLTTTDIIADIYGKKTIGFDEEIKAVTYHEAEVVKTNGNTWETFIIFDI